MILLLLKVTLLLSLGHAAATLARRGRAATRHALLAAALGASLLAPLAWVALPAVTIPVRLPGRAAALGVSFADARVSPPAGTPAPAPKATPFQGDAGQAPSVWTAEQLLLALWGLVAAVIACVLVRDLWLLRGLRRCGLPWIAARSVAHDLAVAAGVRRPVTLVTHEAVQTPLTLGWRRPTILFPADTAAWREDAVRRALVHEIEHVRRHDWPVQLLARAACTIFWFHPLAWAALRRLVLEAERACDDAVVTSCEDETGYAEQLVSLARNVSRLQPGLTMAARGDLAARVTAILDISQQRGRATRAVYSAAGAAALLLVAVIAPLRAVGVPAPPTSVNGMAGDRAAGAPADSEGQRRRISGFGAADLMRAAGSDDIAGLRALIAAGADINGVVLGDGSPLISAARSGSLDAVRVLLDAGADPNLSVPGDGSPLIAAASEGFTDIAAALLDRGARVNDSVIGDENALIAASAEGHLDVVRLLVARGADVNARVWSGTPYTGGRGEWRTPLERARRSGHSAVADFLVASGATR